MIRFSMVLFILIQLSVGHAEEVCQPVNTNPVDPAMEKLALEMTGACTLLDVNDKKKGLKRESSHTGYYTGDKTQRRFFDVFLHNELTSTELCSCLNDNKRFNDIRMPENKKNVFSKEQLNSSVSDTLKIAMQDLYGNITKFKNLNLPKADSSDLHYRSLSLCSPEVLKNELASLEGTCPNAKSAFPAKLKGIFGTSELSEIPAKIQAASTESDPKSCLTKHQYMHLKSSNTTAKTAYDLFDFNSKLDIFFNPLQDDLRMNELLSYDLFMNLSYRDERFRKKLGSRVDFIKKETTPNDPMDFLKGDDIYEDIYNDREVLENAQVSLEENCQTFKNNLKTFLCLEDVPKVSALPLSMLVDDVVNGQQADPVTSQSMRDHFTGKFSCAPEPVLNQDEKKLSDYIHKTKLLQLTMVNPLGEGKTGYKDFNETFCGDRRIASEEDLPGMMKEFFNSKKAAGTDLNALFAQAEIIDKLGFKINTNANPFFTLAPNKDQNGLPEITTFGWHSINAKLKETGLSQNEIDQLYSIIEMQTNSRSRAVNELREEFARKHPDVPSLSPADIDGLLRGSSEVVTRIMFTNPQALNLKEDIESLYTGQQTSRMERFDNRLASTTVHTTVVETPPDTERESNVQPDVPATVEVSNTEPTATNSPGLTVSSPANTANSAVRSVTNATQSQSPVISVVPSVNKKTPDSRSSSSDQSESYSGPINNSSSRNSSSANSSGVKEIEDEIKRIQDEIAQNQRKFNRVSNAFRNEQSALNNTSRSNSRGRTGSNTQYNYPRNVPFRSPEGDYYRPNAEGDELSSASGETKIEGNGSNKSARTNGSAGGSNAPGAKATVGTVNFGSGSSGGGSSSAAGVNGRKPANAGAETDIRKKLNLAPFEYHRYIPHSIFDIVGSVDKVVLLLGLEGKSFKTIEAVEEIDPKTEKINIKYLERTFDFVPEGKFSHFKEGFASKEDRIKTFQTHFSYERNRENLKFSKKYSLATREVSKQEVPHSYVLNIQDYVLSDAEIRDTMNEVMELLK